LETEKSKVLQGYIDTDYTGDLNQRKFTMSYIFIVAEYVVSWKTELQDTVAFSTTKVNYMAAVETSKKVLWLRGLIGTFGII